MKSGAKSETVAELEVFGSAISGVAGERVSQQASAALVVQALEDLRFKRASVADLKARLAGLIDQPTEANMVKWLKAERSRLDEDSLQGDVRMSSTISDLNGELNARITGLVEVPGSYTRFIGVPPGSTLESLSAVRIAGIVNECTSVSAESHLVLPRITCVGTNGLRYSFVAKPGRVDGTGQQLIALVNGLCEKFSQTKQRGLKFNCLQAVPITGGLYLEESPVGVKSFEQILVDATGDPDAVETLSAASRRAGDQTELPSDVLINAVAAPAAEAFYGASKRFTKGVALTNIIDYVCGIAASARPLHHWLMSRDGRVFVRDSQFNELVVNGQNGGIPFRLTRNVVALIGERNMAGLLPASMRSVVDCLQKKRIGFTEFVDLIEYLNAAPGGGVRDRLNALTAEEPGTNLYAQIADLVAESVDEKSLAGVQPKQWISGM